MTAPAGFVEAAALEVLERIRDGQRRMVLRQLGRYARQNARVWRWDLAVTVADLEGREYAVTRTLQAFAALTDGLWAVVRSRTPEADWPQALAAHQRWYRELGEAVADAQRDELAAELSTAQFNAAGGQPVDLAERLICGMARPHPAVDFVFEHLRRAGFLDASRLK